MKDNIEEPWTDEVEELWNEINAQMGLGLFAFRELIRGERQKVLAEVDAVLDEVRDRYRNKLMETNIDKTSAIVALGWLKEEIKSMLKATEVK